MRRYARRAAVLLLALAAAGCRPTGVPPAAPAPLAEPDPAGVERVLFLLGDAGEARTATSPVLAHLARDVERWSAALDADSAVAVLVLGDVIYPEGLHPPDHPTHHSDTAVVMAQVRVVLGEAARARGARILFLAGNHDWGQRRHFEGMERLRNLEEFLAFARRATGAAAYLVPEAGNGGPHVLDFGSHLRLLLLDTAWWLLAGQDERKGEVLSEIDRAMAAAGDREILLAAHHPFRSVGPHGGHFDFWETFGLRYLLARSGAILQDITSVPYRELEYGLRDIFARHGAPLVFAGGHEHSLQVIEAAEPTDPRFNLVSGSGSKLTRVGYEPGVRYAATAPGYMRLVVERDGGVTLFVLAAPPEYQKCGGGAEAAARCMAEGVDAFRTVYSQRLR